MIYYLSMVKLPVRKARAIQQLKMCQGFAKAGADVTFVYPIHGCRDATTWESLSEFYGLSERFSLAPIRSIYDVSIPKLGGLSVVGSMAAWLLSRIYAGKITAGDVIYARNPYTAYLILQVLDRLPSRHRPRIVSEEHNLQESYLKADFYHRLDGMVCITHALKTELAARFDIPDEKLFVAHDGVDLDRYRTPDRSQIEDLRTDLAGDEQIIMYTGNLYPRKGSELLVQAADQLDGHLVVVGGTDERVEQLQTDYACENVTFVGYVKPSAVPRYQQSADVLVAPYTTAALMPSPLKVFEYMAAGSPIVAARIPTISEVLEHEATALLFEPSNQAQFVAVTNRLLKNPAFDADLTEAAGEVVKQYSWERRAQRIQDFITFACY